ncbi:hypothetical protein M407DRAFT_18350 [Tulasnella calospora MUT 4182]|uniref:Uncharacterized protein n=1 Tax=Tulasnella calospora MUT 4182 TaxID=1051891 RepID=A0A0C3QU71_9AGAM|nr:hypothetical protein M407DRAFT_18350 [Tulasnella calospora MUT 4182]
MLTKSRAPIISPLLRPSPSVNSTKSTGKKADHSPSIQLLDPPDLLPMSKPITKLSTKGTTSDKLSPSMVEVMGRLSEVTTMLQDIQKASQTLLLETSHLKSSVNQIIKRLDSEPTQALFDVSPMPPHLCHTMLTHTT